MLPPRDTTAFAKWEVANRPARGGGVQARQSWQLGEKSGLGGGYNDDSHGTCRADSAGFDLGANVLVNGLPREFRAFRHAELAEYVG